MRVKKQSKDKCIEAPNIEGYFNNVNTRLDNLFNNLII